MDEPADRLPAREQDRDAGTGEAGWGSTLATVCGALPRLGLSGHEGHCALRADDLDRRRDVSYRTLVGREHGHTIRRRRRRGPVTTPRSVNATDSTEAPGR